MKILVTAGLEAAGVDALGRHAEIEYTHDPKSIRLLAGTKLVQALEGVDIFVTEADPVRRDVILGADRLQVIAACRGNPVNIDLEAATERGVPVLFAPGRNAEAVAELTIAFLIMLARHIPETSRILREPGGGPMRIGRVFTALKGVELWQKTVGLVGLGAVGRAVAARLRPFEARLVACDPYVDAAAAESLGVELSSLEDLLRRSDFVSLHAPVTPETTGMIGAAQLQLMKPTAYLVNTARAALTDQDALYQALTSGAIAGAALDVYAVEPPPPDYPLLGLANVIATPHIGGNTHDVAVHQSRIIVGDLLRLLAGQAPRNVANPGVLENFRLRWG